MRKLYLGISTKENHFKPMNLKKTLGDKKIALFFSYKVSLDTWEDLGMLSRESRIWEIYGKNFSGAYFVTYGNKDESTGVYFPKVKLLNNKWQFHPVLYGMLLPFLFRKELKSVDIFKVNQLSGALPAIISKLLYRKKLIVRCGFQLSGFFKQQKVPGLKIALALCLERFAYALADMVIVTTQKDKEYVIKTHKISAQKIKVIPNGIDVGLFCKKDEIKPDPGRVLFVGRLIRQKNIFALIEALQGIGQAHLVIIGKGYLKEDLRKKAEALKVRASFIESIKNEELPQEYNRAEIFVLPSFFEGNPKVLLEAMACGLPIVASNVSGINDVLEHGVNGVLSETTAEDLGQALKRLFKDKALCRTLGENARRSIEDNFSLEKTVAGELCEYY